MHMHMSDAVSLPPHLDVTATCTWVLGQIMLWALLYVVCRASETFRERPLLAAYDFTSLVPVVALSWMGFSMQLDPSVHEVPDRPHAYIEGIPYMLTIQLAYQIFATLAAFVVGAPLLNAPMIVHHVMTSFTALVGLNQQFQYYAIYSSGIIESTNIPLTWIDLCTYFPVLKERYFPTLSSVNGAVFAISFLVLRIFGWLHLTLFGFVPDLWHAWQAGDVLPVVVLGVTVTIITGLQLLWGYKVSKRLLRVVAGALGLGSEKKKE